MLHRNKCLEGVLLGFVTSVLRSAYSIPFVGKPKNPQKPTNPKSPSTWRRRRKCLVEYLCGGPHLPQPITLPAVRRLAPAAIGCRERNNITKFPKHNTKFRPPCRHSQRSSLPFPCANYELYQHDVRLPHSAALPPPLPHTFTPNPPSNSSSIALIRVSLHFCRLWVTNLVSGCWVCAEN